MNVKHPRRLWSWHTRAAGGGIWAQAGLSYDGTSIFAATGNTFGANNWSDGEAIIRFNLPLSPPTLASDYFTPDNWLHLDQGDFDLGGTGPLPVDVNEASGTVHFVLALGKDGNAYLLNRDNLGGMGGATIVQAVSSDEVHTAPAVWADGNRTMVAFQGQPANCPQVPNAGLTALRISANPAQIAIAWCAPLDGAGAPIVTSLADGSNPIVWITGAEGDNQLHGFRGDTGAAVFDGGGIELAGLRHFGTILAANGRLYIAGDGRIYSFLP